MRMTVYYILEIDEIVLKVPISEKTFRYETEFTNGGMFGLKLYLDNTAMKLGYL